MKKLIIAAVAIAFSAVVQAGTVSWGSGSLKTAADATGGWSATGVNAAGALVTMSVYLVDADTYSAMSSKSMADLYAWASEQTADYTALNKNTSGTIIGAATAKETNGEASTTYYSVIIAEYTDATYGNMYMATTKAVTANATGTGAANNIFGTTSGPAIAGGWAATAVPEPTSGLLLLLGMAGLALRRKQA